MDCLSSSACLSEDPHSTVLGLRRASESLSSVPVRTAGASADNTLVRSVLLPKFVCGLDGSFTLWVVITVLFNGARARRQVTRRLTTVPRGSLRVATLFPPFAIDSFANPLISQQAVDFLFLSFASVLFLEGAGVNSFDGRTHSATAP